MTFSNTNLRKYFPKIFIRHPVYVCLLLLFFSVASIIAQQVQSIIIERLEKHLFDDEIFIPAEEISYADLYGGNMWGRQIHGHHIGYSSSDEPLFVIVRPVDNENSETNILVTIVKPDFTDLPEDAFNAQHDTKTELIGNSGLTMDDKLSIVSFLNTLSKSSKQDQPPPAQSED
jgi:hypothetical protein